MGPEGLSDEPLPAYLNGLVAAVVVHICVYVHWLHIWGEYI